MTERWVYVPYPSCTPSPSLPASPLSRSLSSPNVLALVASNQTPLPPWPWSWPSRSPFPTAMTSLPTITKTLPNKAEIWVTVPWKNIETLLVLTQHLSRRETKIIYDIYGKSVWMMNEWLCESNQIKFSLHSHLLYTKQNSLIRWITITGEKE